MIDNGARRALDRDRAEIDSSPQSGQAPTVKRYQKKPIAIEAVQFTGNNIEEVWSAFGSEHIDGPVEHDDCAYITTLEGRMRCSPGDWIIRGVKNELYPCRPDIFAETYVEAAE